MSQLVLRAWWLSLPQTTFELCHVGSDSEEGRVPTKGELVSVCRKPYSLMGLYNGTFGKVR